MKIDRERIFIPVTFEMISGWEGFDGSASWIIGEADDSFGFSPPNISVDNITVIANSFGGLACTIDVPESNLTNTPNPDEIEILRGWFGNNVAECISNPRNAINGFVAMCELDPSKNTILSKLGRLAVINDILSFSLTGWPGSDRICPEMIEALAIANDIGWKSLIANK